MNYRTISVLVPTRRRIERLKRFLESYTGTVIDGSQVELVFRCDNDDLDTVRFLCSFDWKFLVGPRVKGYKSLPSFYNEMAKIASGDLLICGNDDMLFETRDWAPIVLEFANRYPDGIFNIGVDTGLNDDKFPFSIVSRQLVNSLGFINDEKLLFSDVFLLDVAKHFGRAMRLRTVRFFHDWAGHGHDETRADANKHEFEVVFADAQGNWTSSYRQKHELAVADAVQRIMQNSEIVPGMVLNKFESSGPPQLSLLSESWPNRPLQWGYSLDADIHYDRDAISILLNVVFSRLGDRQDVIVSSMGNGLASVFWGHVFERVFTVCDGTSSEMFVGSDKHTVAFGSLGETRFLYQLLEKAHNLNGLILQESKYSCLISPYFLFRRNMKRPGIIVFCDSTSDSGSDSLVRRFVEDLRNGTLDGVCHAILDVEASGDPRISYEILDLP
jgi:hypothetical protein